MGDRKQSDRINHVPLELTEETILPADYKKEDIAKYYVEGVKKPVLLIPATEKIRKEYVREGERQKKQKQRQMQKANDANESYALPLSLDKLKEDDDFDIEDTSIEIQLAELRILFDQLVTLVEKTNPLYGPILRLTKKGLTQREIAVKLGKSQSTIKEQQPEALRLIRELYNK